METKSGYTCLAHVCIDQKDISFFQNTSQMLFAYVKLQGKLLRQVWSSIRYHTCSQKVWCLSFILISTPDHGTNDQKKNYLQKNRTYLIGMLQCVEWERLAKEDELHSADLRLNLDFSVTKKCLLTQDLLYAKGN